MASLSARIRILPLKRVLGSQVYKPDPRTISASTVRQPTLMPTRNPLRRLSVALRLTEAYTPAQIPTTPSSNSSLSTYLVNAKNNYLKDIKEDPKKGAAWTVVMGNEAGGMIALLVTYKTLII